MQSDSEPESSSVYAPEDHNPTIKSRNRRRTVASSSGYTFHPSKPHTLLVGISRNDGKDAWLSLLKRRDGRRSYRGTFYNHRGARYTEDQLRVTWNDEFKYSRFSQSENDLYYQKQMQRDYIFQIIEEHENQSTVQRRDSGRVSNNSRTPHTPKDATLDDTSGPGSIEAVTSNANSSKRHHATCTKGATAMRDDIGDSDEDDLPNPQGKRPRYTGRRPEPSMNPTQDWGSELEPVSAEAKPPIDALPPHALAATSLLVSASNQPALAPVNVPLEECPTLEDLFKTLETLFDTLVNRCNLKGKAASGLYAISATYAWNQKGQLIRRDKPSDWTSFIRAVNRAWKKESKMLEEDGCEVYIMAHFND